MDGPSVVSLVERLDRLEHENTWLKRIGGCAVFAALALVTLGICRFRSPQIAAEKFVLHDRSGQPRATLELRPDGSPALRLLDHKGQDQVLLRAERDGSSSLEYYQDRSLRASLENTVGVGPSVNLLHRSPLYRAEMFMADDGTSGMSFNHEDRGASVGVQNDGTSRVSLTDREGEERAGIALAPDGTVSSPGKPDPTGPICTEVRGEAATIAARSRKLRRFAVPPGLGAGRADPAGGVPSRRIIGAS